MYYLYNTRSNKLCTCVRTICIKCIYCSQKIFFSESVPFWKTHANIHQTKENCKLGDFSINFSFTH